MTDAQFLEALSRQSTVSWCGLMSGTSCDGIDAARVRLLRKAEGVEVISVEGLTVPFTPQTAARLQADIEGDDREEAAERWQQPLAELFAQAASQLIERFGRCDAIALSGHTFSHRPEAMPPSTLQAGCPRRVADVTRLAVIDGFRRADVEGGGEGAPLVPAGDRVLLGHLGDHLAIVNIGGISNITWLQAQGDPGACDAGPGNLLLDGVLRQATGGELLFDAGGEIASDGVVDEECVESFTGHSFFSGKVRSCGREQFGADWIEEHRDLLEKLPLGDRLATICRFIARSIAGAIEGVSGGVKPRRLLIGGGGARHRLLLEMITEEVGVVAEPLDLKAHGVDLDLREAAAFAILGDLFCRQEAGSFPSTTGCRQALPIGFLTRPGDRNSADGASRKFQPPST